MPKLPETFIQSLLEQTDLIEILQERIQLKKRGQNFQARCPFHEEKTASFSANHEKQFYYCFGCQASGNAIGFLMAYDHLPFIDAVKALASRAGVMMPNSDEKFEKSNTYEYKLLKYISDYFFHQQQHTPLAKQYLQSRGLNQSTLDAFCIGFSPDDWDYISPLFKKKDAFSPQVKQALIDQGLLIDKNQKNYCRFRNRIMFPIRDPRGRIIGFGARALTQDQQPKYLNSPETSLFHKSKALYGLYECLSSQRKIDHFLVVEGYMDVIGLYQHGIKNAVATLGTASNAGHIHTLLRFVNRITFCFDGDTAGLKAAWKALTLWLAHMRDGIHIHFLFLPQGEDPDSLVMKIGQQAFQGLVADAPPLDQVFFEQLKIQHPLDTLENKASFGLAAKQHILRMPDSIFRQLLAQQLEDMLGTSLSALTKPPTTLNRDPNPSFDHKMMTPSLARNALTILLKSPHLATQINDYEFLESSKDPHKKGLLMLILEINKQFKEKNAAPTTQEIITHTSIDPYNGWAQLAMLPLHIPEEGYLKELLGSMSRLREQFLNHGMKTLMKKAQSTSLSEEDRATLLLQLKQGKNEAKD